MQKWSPEPFDSPSPAPLAAAVAAADFQTESLAANGESYSDSDSHQFRSESGFTDAKSLMATLTPDERSQVYQLVEMDLTEEYQAREQTLRAEFAEQTAALAAESKANFSRWAESLAGIFGQELKETAAAAAGLAVQMATKIVRHEVAASPEILARVIETTIYKIAEDQPLTIQANPAEAAWLSEQDALRDRLHIGEVVADRRIESGGCLVRCGSREWDATLVRQLGSLEEIVAEMVATAAAPNLSPAIKPAPAENSDSPENAPEPEADDDPGLE